MSTIDQGTRQIPTRITGSMLRLSRLFDDMDDAVLEELAASLPVETAKPGQVLITEGNIASHMYVVMAGEVEVVKASKDGSSVRVALLGPGDWVGEMAILDVRPRSATVRVVAPSTLVRVSADDVQRLLWEKNIKQYAVLVRNIGRELSRRLRVADGLIAQTTSSIARQYVEQKRSGKPRL